MVGGRFHLDFLDSKCSYASHSHFVIFGLIIVYYTTPSSPVQASSPVKCRSLNISSKYQHCEIHPDGVHDLDCFGENKRHGVKVCVWKPGTRSSEKTYTLIVQQQMRKTYCRANHNITEFSKTITLYETVNVVVEVLENSESTNCTKAVFKGSPKTMLRCGPPYTVSFSRHSGGLVVNVSWPQEDIKAIKYYSVSYKALGSLTWSKTVQSQNATICTVDNLNSSLVYTVQIQCVTSDKCPQCAVSEAYTVPSELTTQPVIVNLEETDIIGRKGCRLLSLTWKFPATELHDGYYVTVGKASGEAPRERITTTQPEIRLILSYSAYHLNISAVNNASISPAVSRAIPQRGDMPRMGAGMLNVTVHSNTSLTIYWKDDLIKNYVCYSAEWTKGGHKATHMSFYQNKNNYKTVSSLPEPLEPHKRYSITLHTRPDKDTCNMKHVNNSESTYGTTQFYFTQGSPISAPANISSENVTLNSVALQWSSIPEEDIRGFLLGYVIYYNEYHHGKSSTERNFTVDPMLNSCELGNLKSGTAHEVQISGFTRAGAGVRSTASLFKTNDQDVSNLSGLITIFAVLAAVLIFGSPIMKRAKVILWPSIPNPGKSDAMQRIEKPCELDLLKSIDTLRVEEWDTISLRLVEKEDDATPASTSPSELLLLHASEDEGDSPEMSPDWIQRDTEDAAGDVPPDSTGETFPDIRRTDTQSSPFAFSSAYTTLDMFQRGMPANTSVTQATESKPEDTDLTVGKSGLDYIRQFSTSPITDGNMATIL
ncbi:protein sidekick-2 [Anarrhichthys ocellatus]|uniref:protein sidekick-2 n=1 Tax=Anarrhichthys ocellatus TaxID=433405 RepID=UPI0012ED096A|nr:protein sidekick-2-like [Anarrhichthys ocellatus]